MKAYNYNNVCLEGQEVNAVRRHEGNSIKHLPDLLLLMGSALIAAGVSLIYAPAGLIAAGAFLLLAGLKL